MFPDTQKTDSSKLYLELQHLVGNFLLLTRLTKRLCFLFAAASLWAICWSLALVFARMAWAGNWCTVCCSTAGTSASCTGFACLDCLLAVVLEMNLKTLRCPIHNLVKEKSISSWITICDGWMFEVPFDTWWLSDVWQIQTTGRICKWFSSAAWCTHHFGQYIRYYFMGHLIFESFNRFCYLSSLLYGSFTT